MTRNPGGAQNGIENVAIVGLGYIGLPTAVAFGNAGFQVRGFDIDDEKVATVMQGENPLPDARLPNLGDLVDSDDLRASTDPRSAFRDADAIVVAVPTPITKNRDPDLSPLRSAARSIASEFDSGTLVVLESTVYPGCTEEEFIPILEEESDLALGEDFGVAYCPERMNPGDEAHSLDKVTRVLGSHEDEWAHTASEMYESIVPEIYRTEDIRTAEAAKIIENVQRDLNIALVNELALIFGKMGIDVRAVLDAASTKWNFNRYNPGPGVGGHCLPVDPYYLTSKAREVGHHPEVILAGRRINDAMPKRIVRTVAEALNNLKLPVRGTSIGLLGVSYKAETGDIRNSPALQMAREFSRLGADLRVSDPFVDDASLADEPIKTSGVKETLSDARLVVSGTGHEAFSDITASGLAIAMEHPGAVVDPIGLFDADRLESHGITYRSIATPGSSRYLTGDES